MSVAKASAVTYRRLRSFSIDFITIQSRSPRSTRLKDTGEVRRQVATVCESAPRGDRYRRELGLTCYVTDGVDIGEVGHLILVDGNVAVIVDIDAGLFETEISCTGIAPDRPDQAVEAFEAPAVDSIQAQIIATSSGAVSPHLSRISAKTCSNSSWRPAVYSAIA